jgi:mannose-6-phosphate isomerase-like protein (cupin superfamily)
MADSGDPWHASLADGAAAHALAESREGKAFAQLLAHGSMRLLYYAPRGTDPQEPHQQDELYVIASGRGTFTRNGERIPFEPGDVLFASAGDEHRFEDFSDDFATWVIFYGPPGGEAVV